MMRLLAIGELAEQVHPHPRPMVTTPRGRGPSSLRPSRRALRGWDPTRGRGPSLAKGYPSRTAAGRA